MVEESKVEVAKKLNIRPTLIIPLENLVKVDPEVSENNGPNLFTE